VADPTAIAALRASPVADAIRRHRLIAVLRRVAPQAALLDMVEALADDGIRLMEVTFDTPRAADDLIAARERLESIGCRDALVGAGTILGREALDEAARAGTAFAVAPTLQPDVVAHAVDLGVPFIPGAFSPTEIALAWETGATFVKLFPASSLGPSHVRELRGPLPAIELIATGGIDATDAAEFMAAGCVAVGIGSALVKASPEERRAIVAATR
jgi:2-dehydro-3-deoxyphosphogluconate aldolase/(4S)-4-hydroxy-2-oxoglutarate aldolase